MLSIFQFQMHILSTSGMNAKYTPMTVSSDTYGVRHAFLRSDLGSIKQKINIIEMLAVECRHRDRHGVFTSHLGFLTFARKPPVSCSLWIKRTAPRRLPSSFLRLITSPCQAEMSCEVAEQAARHTSKMKVKRELLRLFDEKSCLPRHDGKPLLNFSRKVDGLYSMLM